MLENTELLLNAIRNDQCAEVVLELLEGGVDWTIKDSEGESLLGCAACYSTNPEVISVLIEAGAELDEVDEDGWTPLISAACVNTNHEVISVLIEAGADVEFKITPDEEHKAYGIADEFANTALKIAAKFNTNPKVISVLIEAGTKLDESDLCDLVDLAATSNTNPEVISMLARATDPLVRCSYAAGDRLVECASDISGNRELIDALMEAGAEVSSEDLELFMQDKDIHDKLCSRLNVAVKNHHPCFFSENDLKE